MQYDYQTTSRYFAQVADDIKPLAEEELISLGAGEMDPVYRGIFFTADQSTMFRVNYHSRLVNRILAPLISFHCPTDQVLHRRTSDLPWEEFLDPGKTFAVFTSVSGSNIGHSQFAALRVKDAVVDRFRRLTGNRPSIDTRDPDLWIHLYLHNDRATISVDTSGGSLHRRGYRGQTVEAPMIETLAAAVINMTGWDGSTPLYDPMCGSGTLLCEAYLKATRAPAGLLRKRFGFERLPDFDRAVWAQVRREGMEQVLPLPEGMIAGSDRSFEALEAARSNCAQLDPNKSIVLRQADLFSLEGIEGATIVSNPPYGIRMGRGEDLGEFYRKLGDFLKHRCKGSTAYLFFGDPAHLKQIGLRPSRRIPLSNGGLEGRLARFELY
jgi:putative N6-adenine-specific DNA methylase